MSGRLGILARSLALTLTAGVVFGLAGCGDQGSTAPGYASKDNAATIDSGALSSDEIIPAVYQAALKAGSAHMAMTMKGQGALRAQGDVSYAGGGSTMQMTMSMPAMGAGKMEMRYVGKVLYLQIPGVAQPGKYLAIDPSDKRSPIAKNFAGLSEQMDPLSSVKSMRSAVKSAELVGRGQLQGTPVEHYQVVVDTAKVFEAKKQAVPAGMPGTLTYDMWLDQAHLMRKMVFEMTGTSLEMTMSKWGRAVRVQRPAAADLVQVPRA